MRGGGSAWPLPPHLVASWQPLLSLGEPPALTPTLPAPVTAHAKHRLCGQVDCRAPGLLRTPHGGIRVPPSQSPAQRAPAVRGGVAGRWGGERGAPCGRGRSWGRARTPGPDPSVRESRASPGTVPAPHLGPAGDEPARAAVGGLNGKAALRSPPPRDQLGLRSDPSPWTLPLLDRWRNVRRAPGGSGLSKQLGSLPCPPRHPPTQSRRRRPW